MSAAGTGDPAGQSTPTSIAANGQCFELTAGGHSGCFVVRKHGAQLWVSGAGAVKSKGLTGVGLTIIEETARQSGCDSVAFQTKRPGLVKLAKKQNYKIVGFILEKKL